MHGTRAAQRDRWPRREAYSAVTLLPLPSGTAICLVCERMSAA